MVDQFIQKLIHLQADGYDVKVILNAKKELSKLIDLTYLKEQIPIADKVKNQRMYVEVRYARLTSTTLKENAKVFRLKRDNKTLSTIEYGNNLKQYFDDFGNVATLTLHDLNSVLSAMLDKG